MLCIHSSERYMKKLLRSVALLFTVLLLPGCSSVQPENVPAEVSSSASKKQVQVQESLEQLPSELSIPHFASMRLEGSGLTLASVALKNDAYTRYNIYYYSNGLKITGILNIPTGDGPFPLLIFNHGFVAVSVYTQGRGLKREQDYMAKQGFAVLHTDYRGHAGSDESPMMEKVYDGNLEYAMDSANAILAVREANLPQIDATNVGMLGHSLGGGVTLAVLTAHPELVDAAVLYAPVNSHVYENFVRWRAEREEGDRTIEQFGMYDEKPEIWDNLSPASFIDTIRAPILLFHGDKDKDVPKAWSDGLAADLKAHGKDIEYIEYAGEGHEFSFQWTDFMKRTAEFLQKNVKTF